MALPMPGEFLAVAVGAKRNIEFSTAAARVNILTDKALYIATNEAALGVASTGQAGQRIFVPGAATFLDLPWGKNKRLWLQNVDDTDSERIQIIGTV